MIKSNKLNSPFRLKLIRVLANWENINGKPLAEYKWDGTNYQSPTAFTSPDAIAGNLRYKDVKNMDKGYIVYFD